MSFSGVGQNVGASQEGNLCSICLEVMRDSQSLKSLHEEVGAHVFHRACVDTWLLAHHDCPLCKRVVAQQLRPLPHSEAQVDILFHRNDFAQLSQLGQRSG
jgi:hypothetical protein